ncbi:restriction endonuclease subunit S [Asticcacaulis sp. AND118]|uniref:restriction endonuclease subunit S n=1 Tax=Asticcacaulis sp. AND118 TaxID=2840468 RepID=UPI001CFF65B2|nr:restriction endonuclease subunit S [Asticcacaulis sp. AND118]UDF03273.1 restriction endonuclease subunit S [Asticcacaulis sp. AND118]
MKPGWVKKRLDEVSTLQRGFDLPAPQRTPGRYPLVTSSGATDTHIEAKVKGPGVATGRSGSIGNVFYINEDFWPLNTTLYVKDFHDNDPRFVFYLLQWLGLGRFAAGTGVPTLNRNDVHREMVSLPICLKEQQRIVAILDEAFEGLDRARANAEANLQSLDELFSALLVDSFSDKKIEWQGLALSDLGLIQTGSTPKTSEAGMLGDYLPFIKPGDFKCDGTLDYTNEGLSEKGASVSRIIQENSALMVCIGATIGKAGFNEQPITTNQQINSITAKSGVSAEYIYYQMLTPDFQKQVLSNAGQATLPIINKSKWSALKVKIPARAEMQFSIAKRLREVRQHIQESAISYKAKLADLDDLRQSLLQKAFAGELT